MIMLVPTTPEVPKALRPKLWPGLLFVLALCVGYLETVDRLREDESFVDNLQRIEESSPRAEAGYWNASIRLRPLLRIAPSRGDWDLRRLVLANFLHGSLAHLTFNLIGVFAGARICAPFIPFLCTLSIFVLGGSFGLLVSILFSSYPSQFIPHIGSSAGIFALMGTYYVYNFSFRTRYFFWFPSRHGRVALKTSWFFFVDAILLELLLSAVQFLPGRADFVDHLAHVAGFFSGVGLALFLRSIQRWPRFLQTRTEFLYWHARAVPKVFDPVRSSFELWMELVHFNRYNDALKVKLIRLVEQNAAAFSDSEIDDTFAVLSPTFVRLNTNEVADCIRRLLQDKRKIPNRWLASAPYDSLIRIAKVLATRPENQPFVFELVIQYQTVHCKSEATSRKLMLLLKRLEGLMGLTNAPGGKTDIASESKIPSTKSGGS